MIPGIFVTATGTDVGKTMIAAGLLRRLRQRGVNAAPMKPVQTGATPDASGRFVAPDLDFVLRAAGLHLDAQDLGHAAPYLYEPACSPHLAARLAGRPIRVAAIVEHARQLAARHQFLVVEGAGGLMVPLGDEAGLMVDLIRSFAMPVVLVGHAGLGSINHVLLSLEALRRRGLKVLGVVLNETGPVAEADRFIHDDNARAIEEYGGAPVLARVPWLGNPPDMALLDRAMEAFALPKEIRPHGH